MRPVLRTFVLSLAGLLLVQLAWSLAVAPFRGLDEHEHAFKAAAVARGDLGAHHTASQWGELMDVPADLVAAARPVCEGLRYTSDDNCDPGPARADGAVAAATSASRYDPAYYLVVGTVARPFSGVGALYAMRAASALLCALVLAAAATTVRSWARTAWPAAGLLLATTPTLLYSTAITAPNGLELAGAVLLWAALLGIVRVEGRGGAVRCYVAAAGLGAVPLVLLRSLGPLWCLLVVLVAVVLAPPGLLRRLLGRRDVRVAVLLVGLATLVGAIWTLTAGTNQVPSTHEFDRPLLRVLPPQVLLWFFQAVAAFPARDEMAPMGLYVVAFLAWWLVLALAWRTGERRVRRALVAILVLATAVPLVATAVSYSALGTAWQGRYGYPFALGFVLVCALALDRSSPPRLAHSPLPLLVAGAVAALTGTLGVVGVLVRLQRTSLAEHPWVTAPAGVLAMLVLVGTRLQVAALHRRGPSSTGAAQPAEAATQRSRVARAAPESTA